MVVCCYTCSNIFSAGKQKKRSLRNESWFQYAEDDILSVIIFFDKPDLLNLILDHEPDLLNSQIWSLSGNFLTMAAWDNSVGCAAVLISKNISPFVCGEHTNGSASTEAEQCRHHELAAMLRAYEDSWTPTNVEGDNYKTQLTVPDNIVCEVPFTIEIIREKHEKMSDPYIGRTVEKVHIFLDNKCIAKATVVDLLKHQVVVDTTGTHSIHLKVLGKKVATQKFEVLDLPPPLVTRDLVPHDKKEAETVRDQLKPLLTSWARSSLWTRTSTNPPLSHIPVVGYFGDDGKSLVCKSLVSYKQNTTARRREIIVHADRVKWWRRNSQVFNKVYDQIPQQKQVCAYSCTAHAV